MSEYDSVGTSASGDDTSDGCPDTDRRGQVNFDFAIGASVLVFAIVFAFSVAPGIFASPAADSQEANELRAERAAGWLTEDDRAGNTYCLAELLQDSPTPAAGCGFGAGTLEERLPIDGPVNVSATRNATGGSSAKLCWDDAANETTRGSCPEWLAKGQPYTSAENVGVAQRTVRVGGNETTITVRAW